MTDEKKTCGTCGRWKPGHTGVIGECSFEMEGTAIGKECDINMWIPKEKEDSEEYDFSKEIVTDWNPPITLF